MPSIIRRPWSLSIAQRVLVAFVALLYLVVYHPWSQPNSSIAAGVYSGCAAMLVLASLPRKFRVITALLLAVGASVVVLFSARAILGGHP
jgi:hypothetical protein